MDGQAAARVFALWQGDAVQSTRLLQRIFERECTSLDDLIDRIVAAGRRDAALRCEPETIAAMLAIACQSKAGALTGGQANE
jgi:hypothetical protein